MKKRTNPRAPNSTPIIHNGRKYYRQPEGWVSQTPRPTQFLHRVIWEEAYGPLPEKARIRYRDGNKDNTALSNLYLEDPTTTKAIDHNGRRYYQLPQGYWASPAPKPTLYLHRVIWEEANGPIPPGFDIHHKDQDPNNNALENLERVARPEHMPKYHHGRIQEGHPMPRGEASVHAKLTDAQVLEIRATYVKGRNGGAPALAARFGVSELTIRDAVYGVTWQHLPRPPVTEAPFCPNGHAYSPENTYHTKEGQRGCRTCIRRAHREGRARRRAQKSLDL
jgi:hypothetical protein